jgi:hypothetical protein
VTPTCRCCHRPFTEFDADEVLYGPAGTILILVAPADLLCGPCGNPEGRPWAHREAHDVG